MLEPCPAHPLKPFGMLPARLLPGIQITAAIGLVLMALSAVLAALVLRKVPKGK